MPMSTVKASLTYLALMHIITCGCVLTSCAGLCRILPITIPGARIVIFMRYPILHLSEALTG